MQTSYTVRQWRTLFIQCKTQQDRDALSGLPINLAASFLGISRARIYQLLDEDKLDSVSIEDEEAKRRIALLITQKSLYRRRTIKRKRGQWLPGG